MIGGREFNEFEHENEHNEFAPNRFECNCSRVRRVGFSERLFDGIFVPERLIKLLVGNSSLGKIRVP